MRMQASRRGRYPVFGDGQADGRHGASHGGERGTMKDDVEVQYDLYKLREQVHVHPA
jgi:hypothetical protein